MYKRWKYHSVWAALIIKKKMTSLWQFTLKEGLFYQWHHQSKTGQQWNTSWSSSSSSRHILFAKSETRKKLNYSKKFVCFLYQIFSLITPLKIIIHLYFFFSFLTVSVHSANDSKTFSLNYFFFGNIYIILISMSYMYQSSIW